MKKLLGFAVFLMVVTSWGATNSVPPLIIKGVVDTNASAVQWSPWSCWWLRPATNSARFDSAQDKGDTNRISEAMNVGEAETNAVKDSTQPVLDAGTSKGSSTEFGASIFSGRPIGHRNVEMGPQTLQPGKTATQLGPNNMQIAPGNNQLGRPSAGGQVSGKAATGLGQPSGGIGQGKP